MRTKTQFRSEVEVRDDREQKLKDFIRDGVRVAGLAGKDRIGVLARAPESMVTRVLFELSDELAALRIPVEIVFAGGAIVTSGETWRLSFNSGFAHEIRIVREQRMLDGHEQLVIGDSHVWYGDSMRREPDKRDAYSCFATDDLVAGPRARKTFARIWAQAERVYVHSGIVAAIAKAEQAQADPVSADPVSVGPVSVGPVSVGPVSVGPTASKPAISEDAAMAAVTPAPATLPAAAAETLDAWQPSTRH